MTLYAPEASLSLNSTPPCPSLAFWHRQGQSRTQIVDQIKNIVLDIFQKLFDLFPANIQCYDFHQQQVSHFKDGMSTHFQSGFCLCAECPPCFLTLPVNGDNHILGVAREHSAPSVLLTIHHFSHPRRSQIFVGMPGKNDNVQTRPCRHQALTHLPVLVVSPGNHIERIQRLKQPDMILPPVQQQKVVRTQQERFAGKIGLGKPIRRGPCCPTEQSRINAAGCVLQSLAKIQIVVPAPSLPGKGLPRIVIGNHQNIFLRTKLHTGQMTPVPRIERTPIKTDSIPLERGFQKEFRQGNGLLSLVRLHTGKLPCHPSAKRLSLLWGNN